MPAPVRVRFAPSPTGYLHVGGLRTALYNYLFARGLGGVFVLRIEDTDRSRYVPGAIERLIGSLRWTGLNFDEGPGVGGPHGPYLQSARLPLYREAADRLVAAGHAYPCFCTAERLEKVRREKQAAKESTRYDRACLALSPADIDARVAAGEPHVMRLRVPDDPEVVVSDLIRGRVAFATDQIDDQVLMKSDGYPTYHLANVVDDHAMMISHVIRGEEWLTSTPKHVLLYRFLGLREPQFAHLPLLLNPDRSKLSKRQGDVAAEDYRDRGYFPEALLNFVAFLGWNPGDEREIFSLDELIRDWSLERVGKSGAVFNLEKLDWYQQAWMRRRPTAQIVEEIRPLLAERGYDRLDDAYVARVVELLRERVAFLHDFPVAGSYFFEDPTEYDPAAVAKRWTPASRGLLEGLLPELSRLSTFDAAALERLVRSCAEEKGLKAADMVHPLRIACTGLGGGPGLYELMDALGPATCERRIKRAIETLR